MGWEWIGVIGAGGGVVGATSGLWAAQRARRTDQRVAAQHEREVERRDVRWRCAWRPTGNEHEPIYQCTNIGSDDACNVVVTLYANDPDKTRPPLRVTASIVRRDESIDLDLSEAWAMAIRETEMSNDASSKSPNLNFIPTDPAVTTAWRITWQSPLGTPDAATSND